MCVNPINQPIYQALLDKAASYPPEKHYHAQAYTNVAKCVRAWTYNLYTDYVPAVGCVGPRIASFIYDFRKKNPQPIQPTILPLSNQTDINTPDTPDDVFPSDGYQGAIEAMDTAHNIAAQNAPKHTAWSNDDAQRDDAERAAFQARLDASRVQEVVLGTITDGELRRSSRLQAKPKVQYCDDDDDAVDDDSDDSDETYIDDQRVDEEDEVTRTIKRVCAKNEWPYSDDLVTDYNAWYPTAYSWEKQTYDYNTNTYTPRRVDIVFKRWAKKYSAKLKTYYRMTAMKNGLIKYCNRHGYKHNETMAKKFIKWVSDPANTTRVCTYANNVSQVYDYQPATVVTKWFKTLKKVIIF